MTTLTLQSFSTKKLIKNTLKGLTVFLAKTMLGFQFARQCQANYQVAEMLHRSGDYRPKTVHQIHGDLNRKTLAEYTENLEKIDAKYA